MALYNIKVKGTSKTIEVDSQKINDQLAAYIFQKGLDAVMGRGRAKLGKESDYPTVDEYVAQCMAIAEKQLEELYEGKTRMVGGAKKTKGADAAVQTRMLQIAREYTKSQIRAGNIKDQNGNAVKVSKVGAAEITRAAKAYIEANPDYFRKAAEEDLAKAAAISVKADIGFIKEDEKKVKAAKDAAAAKKAAKEGKTVQTPAVPAKAKAKGKPQAQASH